MKRWSSSAMQEASRLMPTWCKSNSCMLQSVWGYAILNDIRREIRAQYLFEKETSEMKFPQFQDGSFSSNFKLGFYDYLSLLTNRSKHPAGHCSIDSVKNSYLRVRSAVSSRCRIIVSLLPYLTSFWRFHLVPRTMFFQQWSACITLFAYTTYWITNDSWDQRDIILCPKHIPILKSNW